MKLIDTRATDTMPTSLFLTRAEFRELYPYRLNSRMNYIFKHDQPKNVPDGEAKILLKKYPHVIRWDKTAEIPQTNRHQELEKMKYNDLKKYAGTLKMPFSETRVKRDILIDKIVAKEIEISALQAKAKALKGIEEDK